MDTNQEGGGIFLPEFLISRWMKIILSADELDIHPDLSRRGIALPMTL
jgi:hypothetical protein